MQPRKVLAVDDSKLMLKAYEVMLRPIPMVQASNGVEALETLARDPDIDLVLLDINMPLMNGFEVLEHLSSHGMLGKLTVIVVTTEGEDEAVRRGMEAGAAAYLTKPFHADQILGVISGLKRGGSA